MINKLIEGEVVNNWVILSVYGMKNRSLNYNVQCKCGELSIKNASALRKAKECFKCSRKRQTDNGGTRRTHGACSSSSAHFSTYMAWQYMKSRCKGKTKKDKKNYVDRGIKVCERWENSFENFFIDMGTKKENTSLDRIENDKGYSKENCRWATVKEQNDNKRGCIYYEYNGEKLTISRWAEKFGITRSKTADWLKREGIEWCIKNIDKIKKCYPGMSNDEYLSIGLDNRKGHGQRDHSASRNRSHPLHKMYKSWDYIKTSPYGRDPSWIDFNQFVSDMGVKPEGLRLLRKEKDNPFNKENCYWG